MGLMVYLRNYRGDFFGHPQQRPQRPQVIQLALVGKCTVPGWDFLFCQMFDPKRRLKLVDCLLCRYVCSWGSFVSTWFALFISFPCFFGSSCSSQMGPTWSVFSARSSARFPPVTRHAARGARVHRHDDCVFTSRQFTVTIAGLVGGLGSR